jgi:mersacidin/lichenicidin family type 2 lantibiotic
MSHKKTIRAWKDEDFRLSLRAAEFEQLPRNPAGLVQLPVSNSVRLQVAPRSECRRSVAARAERPFIAAQLPSNNERPEHSHRSPYCQPKGKP